MFTLCPHCQFLVALDPATGQAPPDCPRCGKPLAPAARSTDAADAQAVPAQDERATPPQAEPAAPSSPSHDATTPTAEPARIARATRTRAAAGRPAAPGVAPPPAGTSQASTAAATAAAAAVATTATDAATGATATHATTEPATAGADAPAGPAVADAAVANVVAAGAADAADAATPRQDEARAPRQDEAGAPGPPIAAGAADADAQVDGDAAHTAEAEPAPAAAQETLPPPAGEAPAAAAHPRRALPSFARPLHAPAARPRARTVAAIAGLALLLVLQLLLADRARLATDARWRPLLSALCGALRCELPAWREPAAITLLARDVRPTRDGVLHVTATFRNDARWPQPWPALHLALQDMDGRTVGARTFRPEEYRGGARGDARITQSGLAPGQTVQATFDIREPAAMVVAFTFDFR